MQRCKEVIESLSNMALPQQFTSMNKSIKTKVP